MEDGAAPRPRRATAGLAAIAPDGSEIRLLAAAAELATRSSLVEVFLSAGRVTMPVRHRTVEETWYVVRGSGRVWRSPPGDSEGAIHSVATGDALVIPTGWAFQFQAGSDGLHFICHTTPPWPGADEAVAIAEGGLGPPLLGPRNPRR